MNTAENIAEKPGWGENAGSSATSGHCWNIIISVSYLILQICLTDNFAAHNELMSNNGWQLISAMFSRSVRLLKQVIRS